MSVPARVALIAAMFVASLPLPAFGQATGCECLISVPWSCVYPAWWANPALLIGSIYLGAEKFRAALRWGCAAAGLSASWVVHFAAIRAGVGDLDAIGTIASLGPGYWLWLATTIALVVAARDPAHQAMKPAKVAALQEL